MTVLYAASTTLNSTPPTTEQKPPNQAQETAREFEAMFLSQVVDEITKTVDLGSFGGGDAEQKWRSFLANAIADEIAQQGTTGIAQNIETAINNYKQSQKQGDQ